MKNILLKKLRHLYFKNPYITAPAFPYDMRKAIAYADSIGKRVYQLTSEELNMFLTKSQK